jgi:hypothetical protein
MRNPVMFFASLVLGTASIAADKTQAAENAAGLYLLGTKTAMAGFVLPPGTYFVDVNYFYSGDASGTAAAGVALRRLTNLTRLPPPTLTVQADINGFRVLRFSCCSIPPCT